MQALTALDDPHAEIRSRISHMAAVGLPNHQIAFIIGIGLKTLQRFYTADIELAVAKANLEVLEALFQLAKSRKNPSVTMFWAKSRCGFQATTTRPEKPPKYDPY